MSETVFMREHLPLSQAFVKWAQHPRKPDGSRIIVRRGANVIVAFGYFLFVASWGITTVGN